MFAQGLALRARDRVRDWARIVVLAAGLASPGAVGAETSPANWVKLPDPVALYAAYPAAALKARQGGVVRLACVVGLDGKAKDCRVASEDPPGYGFGDAALSVATAFELKPASRDGQPVADAPVTIPVSFSPPPAIVGPRWAKLPSADDMASVYPPKAMQHGVGGRVVLSCLVGTGGALGACAVVSETPADMGFGAAALALSPTFLMSPATLDGKPVAGGVVRIPIIFSIPGGASTVTLSDHRLYRALVWARQPSRSDVLAAVPSSPSGTDPDGTVVLQCWLDFAGRLVNCRVVTAKPSANFEAAALKLARQFEAKLDPEKGPTRDDAVNIVIHLWAGLPTDRDVPRMPPLRAFELTILKPASAARLALPDAAVTAGLASAWAEVECAVAEAGRLASCRAVGEEVKGVGLGAVAEQASADIVVATWNDQGESTLGRKVRLKLVLAAKAPGGGR